MENPMQACANERVTAAACEQDSTNAEKEGVCTNPMQRARKWQAEGRNVSAHLAIKVKCWECMGGSVDEWDADTRKNIRECTASPGAVAE